MQWTTRLAERDRHREKIYLDFWKLMKSFSIFRFWQVLHLGVLRPDLWEQGERETEKVRHRGNSYLNLWKLMRSFSFFRFWRVLHLGILRPALREQAGQLRLQLQEGVHTGGKKNVPRSWQWVLFTQALVASSTLGHHCHTGQSDPRTRRKVYQWVLLLIFTVKQLLILLKGKYEWFFNVGYSTRFTYV